MSEIEISDDILIPCPLVGYRERLARLCVSCEHFGGLKESTVNGEPIKTGDVVEDYQVDCKRPVGRRMKRFIKL